jgi:uncharacterized protein (TIGR02757 family)
MSQDLKKYLNSLYEETKLTPLDEQVADPLQVANKLSHPIDILICALFSYGNANQIVKFLKQIDFKNLDKKYNIKYRFQTIEDVNSILKVVNKIKKENIYSDEDIKKNYINNGIPGVILYLQNLFFNILHKDEITKGMLFFLGKPFDIDSKSKGAYKRYNMFLRWMVRDTDIDLGYWSKIIDKSKLIIPLDTHVLTQCKEFGFITNKSSTWKNAILITKALQKFDNLDPIKYDFAIYRIGQKN